MKIDITSMFFNSKIEGQTATAAWGTSIGQNKTRDCRIDDFKKEIVDMVIGMTYKSVQDLEHLDISKSNSGRDIITCAVFNNIFINNKKVDDSQYVLLLVREHTTNHEGRLLICYAPYIGYNNIYNRSCIKKMQDLLGCKEYGCWFVYDISIINQSDLHFKAVVVNPDAPMIYQNTTSQSRSKIWKALVPDQQFNTTTNTISHKFRQYVTAIKSKPFILLAGISGTGKSRIVRELARACYPNDSEQYKAHKPANFEMIQVKPNWHDSSELLGYISRIDGEKYIAGDFLKFIVKAWVNNDIPHFLCLDEMNLAPVEQYFAEYLSVIESRKLYENKVITDPILKPYHSNQSTTWYTKLINELLAEAQCPDEKLYALTMQFKDHGITIPQNLIIMGTVNMDETTFSFSRKVLDRAMSIEMNEVNLQSGLEEEHENIGQLSYENLIGNTIEGKDVYTENKEVCEMVLSYLGDINRILEGTPFKIAYRTRNEFLLYVVNNLPYCTEDIQQNSMVATALDEITSMKILSRIEGDDMKIQKNLLQNLHDKIKERLDILSGRNYVGKGEGDISVSLGKLEEMEEKLDKTGYVSYWT